MSMFDWLLLGHKFYQFCSSTSTIYTLKSKKINLDMDIDMDFNFGFNAALFSLY